MKKLRRIRSSIVGPVILFVISLVLMVALLVLWNVVLAVEYQQIKELAEQAEQGGSAFHWTFIALGSALFVAVISLLSILGAQLFGQIRYSQRLGTFVATFTHELNSPLASIKLFAQTLQRGEDMPRAEQERFLELILADVDRLGAQIANVLRAAQVDRPNGLQLVPETVDVHGFLVKFAADRQAAVERLERDIRIEMADGPAASGRPSVRIDKLVFRQALDNLIDNSIKYARAGEPVRIELGLENQSGGWVTVEVRDNGRGIEREHLDRVFDRFSRIEERTDAQRKQGTGLGLWIVHAIVDAHGGHVEADSPGPGKGATMRILLPEVPPMGAPQPARTEEVAR